MGARFAGVWALRVVVLRYSYWVLVVVEYFGRRKRRVNRFRSLKKIRELR